MFKATAAIKRTFEDKNIKFRVVEKETVSYIEASVRGKVCPSVDVCFFSSDDDNDVAVRVLGIVRAPEEKKNAVFEAVNECNNRFRFVKFIVDKDNDVDLEFDMPVNTVIPGEVAFEMLVRIMQILDDAYPVLMKALWS